MQTRFYLRPSRKAGAPSAIWLDCAWHGQRHRQSTGETCLDKEWDNKKERIKSSVAGYREKNQFLEELEGLAKATYRQTKGLLSPEELKKVLRPSVTGQEEALPLAKWTVKAAGQEWQRRNEAFKSRGTLRQMNNLFYHLDRYAPTLRVEQVEADWWSQFLLYLYKHDTKNGTATVLAKKLRSVRKMAGLSYDFLVVPKGAGEKQGLGRDDLRLLETWHEYKPGQEAIRDCFLFMCYTGLRFSDLKALRPSDVRTEGEHTVITRWMQKTRKAVQVVLSGKAKALLDKYAGGRYCLPVPTNQEMNRVVKLVARGAGLNRLVTVTAWHGLERKESVVPLWETVTCHTARHTFATLSLLGGMDIVHLADVLGVTLNVVTTYAKTLPTERHRQLLEAWKE